VVVFLAGDAEAEASAEADVFFEVVAVPLAVLFFVVVALVVVPVDVAVVSSFFWVWQPRNAVNISAVIKDKTDVFIGLVQLNELRGCRSDWRRASTKSSVFSFQIPKVFM
jgi:hypothetical protein